MKSLQMSLLWLLLGTTTTRADVALLLEEPFGTFGGLNPTGHAAIYLSRVCADSLFSLRRCGNGEQGVVISRYHRIAGYDWLAIPLIPYLYAIDRPDQVPRDVPVAAVDALRDDYRRRHLEDVASDEKDGGVPPGDWTQLIGAAYDRTIYTFEIQTLGDQDDAFIRVFNSRSNQNHFNLVFYNCADFARQVINFYYPGAIHRSFTADMGIMTPKQAARCLIRYNKKHPDLQFSSFVISQVSGTTPRSSVVRSVVGSLLKSKKYILPLAPVALLHPYFGGSLVLAWIQDGHFNPRRFAGEAASTPPPEMIAQKLQSNKVASTVAVNAGTH